MKKLLLLSSIILCAQFGTKAQSNRSAATPSVVTDTLNYYFNKQVFKIANILTDGYPYYKSAAATVTNITHVGAVFLNTDPFLKIDGLEARVSYNISSNALTVPVRLYLCNVDANLLPIWPPIDSVGFTIGQTELPTGFPTGHSRGSNAWIGTAGSKTVTGNYAILIRNISTLSADTINLYRTASLTRTNVVSTAYTRMGEGFGLVRQNGSFKKTTDFIYPGFGYGTDYEFCVAPRVTYTLEASHLTPPQVNSNPTDTVMCWQPLTFTNTSTSHFTNRFFNLNEFYRHLYPYASTPPPPGFSPDSAISWFFDDEDFDYPGLRPNIILKNNATTATKYYDTAGCFTNCSMRARLKKMTVFGTGSIYYGNITFSVCVGKNCDYTGVNENSALNKATLYPNPSSNGKVTISGLSGSNTIFIYNLLGQLISKQITREEQVLLDLSVFPKGNYILKLVDEHHYYKTFKVVSQEE